MVWQGETNAYYNTDLYQCQLEHLVSRSALYRTALHCTAVQLARRLGGPSAAGGCGGAGDQHGTEHQQPAHLRLVPDQGSPAGLVTITILHKILLRTSV